MFERILIPLDGSASAELILAQLKPLLKHEGAEVFLLQAVYDPPSIARIDTGKLSTEHGASAEAYLQHIVHRLKLDGIHAHGIVKKASADEAIFQTARERNVQLIAMTTHGRSALSRWMMGSVTEKVLRAAEVPLLIIHSFKRTPFGDSVPLAGEPVSFKSIVVPIDVGDQSLAILPFIERLAKLYESEIVLLHVRPESPPVESFREKTGIGTALVPLPNPDGTIPQTVTIAEGRLSNAGIRFRRLLLKGNPPSQILEATSTGGFDLLAMATHGRSGLKRWVMGSIAERILRSSPIPMFVVPSTADK